MNAASAIQRNDIEALKAHEHEILESVNEVMESFSTECEDYMSFWIASCPDHTIGSAMYEVFLNTCRTTFKPEVYEEALRICARPTMVGAIDSENIEILELIKDCVGRSDFWEAIQVTESEKVHSWYEKTFS